MMVPTKRRRVSSSSSSVEVAAPPKKLKLSSSSTSPLANKSTTPDWLPDDGWTVAVLTKPTGHKYKVFKETATGKKFYSKPQVLNYLAIPDANLSNNTNVRRVAPPKKKQVSTSSTTPSERTSERSQVTNFHTDKFDEILQMFSSASSSFPPVKVAPPKKKQVSTLSTTPSERSQVTFQTDKIDEMLQRSSSAFPPVKVAPPQKNQVSASSTTPSEIPKPLYDLIQNAARARQSLKRNSNNRFAKRKLEYYERRIPCLAMIFIAITKELPYHWKYDPETSFMTHVPKPSPPPSKPKPKPKTKKKIKITWRSPNYHGRYPLNNDEQKVWNKFTINEKTKANSSESYPLKNLVTVEDDMVIDLLGKFAVDTFNKSCRLYLNRDKGNMVSGAEFIECKFYKLTKKYIFYLTIEAIEQGIRGVYTAKVKVGCKINKGGARTLLNFELTDRKPKWNMDKPQLESEVEYETVEDGSSDPQDFYKLTGMVHRDTMSVGGGFNYHNPAYSAHIIIYSSSKKARIFLPNVSRLSEFLEATKDILVDC